MDRVTSIVPEPKWNSLVLFQYRWPLRLIFCHWKQSEGKRKGPVREEFVSILSFPVFCELLLFPNGKYCTRSVNKGRVKKKKKGSCKKHNEFSCPEGCLIKGTCLFSAVEQQSLSLPNTNIAINFNFLHFFGHQRDDRIAEEEKK